MKMSAQEKFKDYIYERDKALANLDLEWVLANTSTLKGKSDEVILMCIHKARYEATGVLPKLRHESREWLQARGLRRLSGEFLPKDKLPT